MVVPSRCCCCKVAEEIFGRKPPDRIQMVRTGSVDTSLTDMELRLGVRRVSWVSNCPTLVNHVLNCDDPRGHYDLDASQSPYDDCGDRGTELHVTGVGPDEYIKRSIYQSLTCPTTIVLERVLTFPDNETATNETYWPDQVTCTQHPDAEDDPPVTLKCCIHYKFTETDPEAVTEWAEKTRNLTITYHPPCDPPDCVYTDDTETGETSAVGTTSDVWFCKYSNGDKRVVVAASGIPGSGSSLYDIGMADAKPAILDETFEWDVDLDVDGRLPSCFGSDTRSGPCTTTQPGDDAEGCSVEAAGAVAITFLPFDIIADDGTLTTDEDTDGTGTLTATDEEGDPLTFEIDSDPSHGTVVIDDPSTGDYTYTPDAGYFGTDSFTFTANDGPGAGYGHVSEPATITITVNEVP